MSVFVDSSVLVAAALPRDQHHSQGSTVLGSIAAEQIFTTDHVLVESWSLIRSRAGRSSAVRFWRSLPDTALIIESVTLVDLERARAISEHWDDQDFSLVDCTSFAVMERLGCRRAATFDRDFAVYRYGADRTKAFEILS